MREIKFRAWYKRLKTMIEVESISSSEITHWLIRRDGMKGIIKRDDIELMQFTGLKDKNAKDIYEGDIVKHYSHQTLMVGAERLVYSTIVKFVDGVFEPFNFGFCKDDYEVIGNIYENPEMIKNGN